MYLSVLCCCFIFYFIVHQRIHIFVKLLKLISSKKKFTMSENDEKMLTLKYLNKINPPRCNKTYRTLYSYNKMIILRSLSDKWKTISTPNIREC